MENRKELSEKSKKLIAKQFNSDILNKKSGYYKKENIYPITSKPNELKINIKEFIPQFKEEKPYERKFNNLLSDKQRNNSFILKYKNIAPNKNKELEIIRKRNKTIKDNCLDNKGNLSCRKRYILEFYGIQKLNNTFDHNINIIKKDKDKEESRNLNKEIIIKNKKRIRESTTGSGTYDYGTHVSISATAADGYRFRAWNDGNTYPIRTVVVEGNETYTAYFDAIEYQVEVRPNNTICGSTTGSGTYSYMDEVTATATPAAGFVFDHWSDGSTENPYVFNVTHNITLIAVFVSDGSSEEGIDDVETLNYSIYPNPTTGKVNIQSTTVENEPMKLYNLYGQLLQTLPAGSTVVDLSGYAKGTYFLRIGSHSVKLVKM